MQPHAGSFVPAVRTDVIVVGAGAAGLTAARALHSRGVRIRVLEARDRIGGRVWTRHVPGVPLPIELGAEFVHGEAPETNRLAREGGLGVYDAGGEHRMVERGRVKPPRAFVGIGRVLERIDPRRPDESFGAFLAREPGGRRLAAEREAARGFVQGFHAADVDRISARSIAPAADEPPIAMAMQTGRIVEGYGALVDGLARDLRAAIRLRAIVQSIDWTPGRVEVRWRSGHGVGRERASAAIVTLPIGVLRARAAARGAVAIRPDPVGVRAAIGRVTMGSALRVVVTFRDAPWAHVHDVGGGRLADLGFIHTPNGAPFNVWWTAHPFRWPLLVGWSGGPPALELAGQPSRAVAERAVHALARSLGVPRAKLAGTVTGAWRHDWWHDPFARGAYSYALVGGADAAKALARPVRGTLFFAGEATDTEGETGTVEGAIASGLRAAKQVVAALGR